MTTETHTAPPDDMTRAAEAQMEDATALVPGWQGRTLRPDEMSELLRRAQESAPARSVRPEPNERLAPFADSALPFDDPALPFETTMIMDRASLGRMNRTLRPDEFPALPPMGDPEAASRPASPVINLRMEKTPAEFSHLYASLERQIAGVGDVTLISGETLGSDRPYVLGITSALLGEGKTTVALHLAMTIAQDTFKRVCLIDMSLGRGDLAARLGVPPRSEGVIPVLEDTDNVVPTLQLAGCDNLVIIPAGKAPANAARLARSPRVAQLILSARSAFDVVIVDLPAVASDNALPLTRHVDGLLVVARAGVTPRDVVAQALDALGRDKVIGVTMNRVKPVGPAWLRRRAARA
jgi:Mrp family chromosome partitioning ATPase